MMYSPNRQGIDRGSLRTPEGAQIHITPKVEAIYNSLVEYKRELMEPEQYRDIYTPDLLVKILEKKAGKPINQDVFLELFQRVKKNMRSEFNIYDWIQTYIEAEDILTSKIERCKLKLSDLSQEEAQLQTWLEAERSNMSAFAEKSLWINILSGELVYEQKRKSFKAPPFVRIQYGENTLQSKIVDNLVRPHWNQAFKIPLNRNDSFINISVWDTQQHLYGSIKLNVSSFEDQKKRKEWVYLSSNKKDGTTAKLHVSIVLLNSDLEKIQNEINEKEAKMNEVTQDLADYEQMLSDLYAPFKSLNFGEFRSSVLNQSNRPSVFTPDIRVGRTEKKLVERLTFATSKYISNWAKFFFIISAVILGMAFIINMMRPSLIEVVVIIFIYCESVKETLTQFHMRMGLGLGFLSLLGDIYWLFNNSKDWCDIKNPIPGCEGMNFIVTVTYINILVKLIWLIALWRNSAAFEEYQERAQLILNRKRATVGIRDGRDNRYQV